MKLSLRAEDVLGVESCLDPQLSNVIRVVQELSLFNIP